MRNKFLIVQIIVLLLVVIGLMVALRSVFSSTKQEAQSEIAAQIESALYTRTEFFGAQAIVPYPTAEARNRIEELAQKYPNEGEIFLNLSQLEEKLGNSDKAETAIQRYADLNKDKAEGLNNLANFFHRRAEFLKEAETVEKLMAVAKPEQKVPFMERLFELGKTHKLERYTEPETYEKIMAQDSSALALIQKYIERLIEQQKYDDALKIITQYKTKFPDNGKYFLEKEIFSLEQANRIKESEAVYHAAFNPFWSGEETDEYYQFLSNHDRLRVYGVELRNKFRDDPTNFDVAVRLYHFLSYSYYSEDAPDIFSRLESERAKRNIKWKPDELATVARILIAGGDGDSASRFLYTLYTNGELKKGNELRAKILYQLFELLIDAEDERLSLTRGDLQFYSDVAKSDPNPGMIGGVLSLLFSDTKPQKKLANLEEGAVKHFNRAAAFRVFTAYKEEYPTSPQLAQMYLDVVRLYAREKEVDKAANALKEFEQRYGDATQFPSVALKLADAYSALKRREEERDIYQKILDYYGKHKPEGVRLVSSISNNDTELTSTAPSILDYPFESNQGITKNSPPKNNDDYYYRQPSRYGDFIGNDLKTDVSYELVLARYVSMLSQDKRTQDILALYANEVKKYPDEQGLYEQWLQWLGQTENVEEQSRVYKEALKQFKTMNWNDRMSRWFLTRERNAEFEKFSREILSSMNDEEAAKYLAKFISDGQSVKTESFQSQLYLGLYSLAHQRFPHNQTFVRGLLNYYSLRGRWEDWRKLMAEYYFESAEIRNEFLRHLAEKKELRAHLNQARNNKTKDLQALPYKLFRADAAVWLANYEEAIDAYRELNRLYPNTQQFADRLVSFTRSFGQQSRKFLEESASVQKSIADTFPADVIYRTRSGEIQAELGNYDKAKGEWEQLIDLGKGDEETYLDAATVYWDYYQYDDALRTIKTLRGQKSDEILYAFQAGALYEAKHKPQEALTEYVKALDENSTDFSAAERRLKTLWKRDGLGAQIEQAFNHTVNKSDAVSFGFASLLIEVKENAKASTVLRNLTAKSNDPKILERANDLFGYAEDTQGQENTLARLRQTAESPRYEIWYGLRLANTFEDNEKNEKASATMRQLLNKFSTNKGVINEAVNFFRRTGDEKESLKILQSAVRRSKGKFRYQFAQKLAARQLELNQNAGAQKTLEMLHDENKLDASVFHELARVYVRTNNQTALRNAFDETIEAIKSQDIQISDMRSQIASFREEMIEAFTRIKDYTSAIDQHIEVINRNPEDEQKLDAAINYVRRYGGAERLLEYYKKTSQTAYKNYRWNVVLGRIYEANKDYEKASAEYRAAIGNQPEMLELYDALAHVYERMKNYDKAIETLNKTLELSNDDAQYVRRLVAVLELAGRKQEADIARQKLPPEPKREQTLSEKLREAESLRANEKEKSVAKYKEVFNTILAEPLKYDLRSSDIIGYVRTVSDVEGLTGVTKTLWTLRDKLVEECSGDQSRVARVKLQDLDHAFGESVGGIAVEKATGEELGALYSDLNKRIEIALANQDQYGTLDLLVNLSHRSGFNGLEEKVLIAQKDAAFSKGEGESYHAHLRSLVSFYTSRGKFNSVIELLNAEIQRDVNPNGFEYWQLIAENARLIGDSSQELEALRQHYKQAIAKKLTSSDLLTERYFKTLLERSDDGRNEIRSLIQQPSTLHNWLIGFLLSKGEKSLAHEAIDKANESKAWRLARNAEASNAFKEFDAQNENYFLQVLNYKPIGDLVLQKPDATEQAIGNEWSKLANLYGEWLYAADKEKSRFMLPALIESRPQDSDEQVKLARRYLNTPDTNHAIEHFQIALEMRGDDKSVIADLGTAYFISGDAKKAHEQWAKIIEGESTTFDDFKLYFETLTKNGLADEARKTLTKEAVSLLKEYEGWDYEDHPYGRDIDEPKNLIRVLSASFDKGERKLTDEEEGAKAQFFLNLYETAPETRLLAEVLIRENLVQRKHLAPFYHILIKHLAPIISYNYDSSFKSYTNGFAGADEAEEIYQHQNDYIYEEPNDDILSWQHQYLDLLIETYGNKDAQTLITEIEKELKGKYARPVWLRLAKSRLLLRDGNKTQALLDLRHLIGIETFDTTAKVSPPNVERLNEAVAILREEHFLNESLQLQEDAYSRAIALSQYDVSSFAGLAKIFFEHGDSKTGLQYLNLMIRLSDEEQRAATENEIASLPLIKSHTITETTIEQPERNNSIEIKNALSIAAQTASEWKQIETAIEIRKRLNSLSTEDIVNRLELSRLFASSGKTDEAIETLSQIINDRNVFRTTRWQAVWLSQEIIEAKKELWSKLNASDGELNVALNALALYANGRTDEALKQVERNVFANPNPELRFFYALLLERAERKAEALSVFSSVLQSGREAQISTSFGFSEDSVLRQMIRLHIDLSQPRAALKLAENDVELKKNESFNLSLQNYQTISYRTEYQRVKGKLGLLAKLAQAAEQLKDFDLAIAYESSRWSLLTSEDERRESEARINNLREMKGE